MNNHGAFSIWENLPSCELWGKILWLRDLSLAGFMIPNTYYILDILTLSLSEFMQAIRDCNLGFPIILRSSANVEDGSIHSYAWLFQSFVCESEDAIGENFLKLKNFNRENIAHAYPLCDFDSLELHCIVQPYMTYQFSGVFISDYTERGIGYGECVNGNSLWKILHLWECDYRFFIRGTETDIDFPYKEIVLDQYNKICAAFSRQSYQYEWCIAGGEMYFFQKRPYIQQSWIKVP